MVALELIKIDFNAFVEDQTRKMLSRDVTKFLLQFRSIYSLKKDGQLSPAVDDDDALAVTNFRHHTSQHHGICRRRREK